MESLSLENIIKDMRNFFRLKEELNYTAIKEIRNLFRLEKGTKKIKNRILRLLIIFLSMKKKILINQ